LRFGAVMNHNHAPKKESIASLIWFDCVI
jgi:hypothetical protein